MVSPFEIYRRTSRLTRIGFQTIAEVEDDLGGGTGLDVRPYDMWPTFLAGKARTLWI